MCQVMARNLFPVQLNKKNEVHGRKERDSAKKHEIVVEQHFMVGDIENSSVFQISSITGINRSNDEQNTSVIVVLACARQ